MHLFIIIVAAILVAGFFLQNGNSLWTFLLWFSVPLMLLFAIGFLGHLTE